MDDCSTPKTYDVFAGPYPIETLGLFTALCDANWPIDAALTAIEQKTAERRAPTTDNVIDLAAYTAKTAEAVVIAPDGEPLFNERDTEALDRHSKAAGYAYDWRDASGHGLTVRAVIEVGRNWAACKRIAKDAFKDWFEYTGGWPVEGAECFINAYELSLKHNAILNLPARAILLVSCPATPEAARTKIIKRVEAGEKLSEDKVETIIRRANGGHKIDLGFW